jgi:hypothetical protein
LTALSAAVDQLPPGDATADVPRGAAVEEHVARDGTATASMGGSTDPPAGWTAVVELVRQLLDDLTSASHARATLELRVDSPRTATLSVVGREPLAIAPESLRWHVEHLDRDGVPIATWTPPGPEGGEPPEVVMPAELQPQSPGVVRELALDHGWSLGDGDMVRVWATITTADPDDANGVPRTARLVAVAP